MPISLAGVPTAGTATKTTGLATRDVSEAPDSELYIGDSATTMSFSAAAAAAALAALKCDVRSRFAGGLGPVDTALPTAKVGRPPTISRNSYALSAGWGGFASFGGVIANSAAFCSLNVHSITRAQQTYTHVARARTYRCKLRSFRNARNHIIVDADKTLASPRRAACTGSHSQRAAAKILRSRTAASRPSLKADNARVRINVTCDTKRFVAPPSRPPEVVTHVPFCATAAHVPAIGVDAVTATAAFLRSSNVNARRTSRYKSEPSTALCHRATHKHTRTCCTSMAHAMANTHLQMQWACEVRGARKFVALIRLRFFGSGGF